MIDVLREIKRLSQLTVGELRDEHERVAGEPLRSNNRAFLTKRLLWQLQAADSGGLTERCRERAAVLARERDLRIRPTSDLHEAVAVQPEVPAPATATQSGSLIVKVYRGRRYEVRVLERGFEWDGRVFKSLTAIAREITGAHWNGRLFFGLTSKGDKA